MNSPELSPSSAQPYHHGNLREALVQASVELARSGGAPAIVLREAARRVGVSATAAYRHFDALPSLVDAVAGEALGALARAMEDELARCTAPDSGGAAERMRAIGRGYVHFALAEPGLFAVACTRPSGEVDVEPGTGDSGLSPHELLYRSLDELVAAGELAAEDREAAATLAWALVHGLSLLLLGPLNDVPAEEREAMIESSLELVGRGFLVRP